MPLVYRLAVNFPAMNATYGVGEQRISFWTVLGEQLAELGWSTERVRYAVNQMLRNCPYKEFRVAEFLRLDRQVEVLNDADFARLERSGSPHAPIVSVLVDGTYKLLWQRDADAIGLTDYRRRYTTWEASRMSREERQAAGIRWYD